VFLYGTNGIIISGNQVTAPVYTGVGTTEGPCIALGQTTLPSKNVIIANNKVEGFDAFWDPDSMQYVEVGGNITNQTGIPSLGYGTQEYINFHDNTFIEPIEHPSYHCMVLFGNSAPVHSTFAGNKIIVETGGTGTINGLYLTGGFDFSGVIFKDNVMALNGNLTNCIVKEGGTEVPPHFEGQNDFDGKYTKNGGVTGAIATGTAVNHGLITTPTRLCVTAAESGPTDIYADTVGTTSFKINFGGGGNKTFYWKAEVV
jgi:hypothetical protein